MSVSGAGKHRNPGQEAESEVLIHGLFTNAGR